MSECRVRFEAHVLAKKKDTSWLEKEPTDPKRTPWPGEYAVVQTEVEWRAWKAGWEDAMDTYSGMIAKMTILADRLGGEAGEQIRKAIGLDPNP